MTSQPDALQRSLADRLSHELTQTGVPGGAASISWDGRDLEAASGVSSTRTGAAVHPQTLFRVGSVTKVLVATALMKLVEDGKIALDDPVRRHLPDFSLQDSSAAKAVTVGDLLTHRGGFHGDFIERTGENDDALELHVQHMCRLPQTVAPGQYLSYSNAGYCVLGRIIEVVAGGPFEQALRYLALEPFGVQDARFSAAETITSSFSVGHVLDEGGASVLDTWELPRCSRPAGGLVTTARALTTFAAGFVADSGYLSAETRELMTSPQVDAVGTESLADQFGMGWFIRDVDGKQVISHGGDVFGQHALLLAVPEAGFAIAVTSNGDGGERACEAVCRWALDECLGLDQPPDDGRGAPPSEQAREAVAGRYRSSLSDIEVALGEDGSSWVTLEPRPVMPGWPAFGRGRRSAAEILSDDIIVMTEGSLAGSRARVIRAADGRVAFLRVEGRLAAPI